MLILWHVKCTASQNQCNPSHWPKHIFNWSYFQVLFTVIHRSVLILLKKQKWWSHTKKHTIYGPSLRSVSVLHENGIGSDRYENNLCRVGPTRSQTSLSSFLGWSYVNAQKEMYGERYAVFSPGCSLAGFPQEKLKWRIKTKKMRPLGRRGKLRVKWT